MKRKKSILLFVETSRAFGRRLLQGIAQFILEHEEWIVHVEDRGLLESTPSWIKSWRGDGIISRTSSLKMAKILDSLPVPHVELLGNGVQVVPEVRNREEAVARLAVEHFSNSGLTQFGFFGIGNAWWSELRQDSFEREVRRIDAGLHVFPHAGEGVRVFYPTWEPRFDKTMIQWLKRLPKPIGVWAVSDTLAAKLLEGCRRIGLSVPEEVAILGTTNDDVLCNLVTPHLSSIDLNAQLIGYRAAGLLSQKIRSGPPERQVELVNPQGVIARQSTDVVACPNPLIASALRLIREHATENIDIAKIAKSLDVSRSTIQRQFRLAVGRTIDKEIMRVRMEKAKLLLHETRLSLSAIAAKTGFSTADYFIQAFHREVGITPNHYRKNQLSPVSKADAP